MKNLFNSLQRKKTLHHPMKVELVKHSFVLTLHIDSPLETIRELSHLLEQQKVIVEKMQLHRYRAGDALLIIHGLQEKSLLEDLVKLAESLPGVMELEKII